MPTTEPVFRELELPRGAKVTINMPGFLSGVDMGEDDG